MSLLNKNNTIKVPVPESAKVSDASVGLLDDTNAEKTYMYSTPNADNYTIQLSDENVSAYRGVLTLNQAQHDEVQKLITKHKRFDISQNIILLDFEAAERIAKEHIEKESQRHAAARGASSTMDRHRLEDALVGEQKPGDRLRNLDVIEEGVMHAEDNNLDPQGQNADVMSVITQ